MTYIVPVGRYAGLVAGAEVADSIIPIRDTSAQYAVLEVPRGTIPAPSDYAPLLEIASRAPLLNDAITELERTPHNLDLNFTTLYEDRIVFTLEEQADDLPQFVVDHLLVGAMSPLTRVEPQPEGWDDAYDSELFEAPGGQIIENRHLVASLIELGSAEARMSELLDGLRDRLGDTNLARSRHLWARALRRLIEIGAIYVKLEA